MFRRQTVEAEIWWRLIKEARQWVAFFTLKYSGKALLAESHVSCDLHGWRSRLLNEPCRTKTKPFLAYYSHRVPFAAILCQSNALTLNSFDKNKDKYPQLPIHLFVSSPKHKIQARPCIITSLLCSPWTGSRKLAHPFDLRAYFVRIDAQVTIQPGEVNKPQLWAEINLYAAWLTLRKTNQIFKYEIE